MRLSVIIPVYNEETTVAEIVEKVRALEIEKEVLVINDGSTDGTREALRPYDSGVPGVQVVHSPVNLGKGASVRMGFALARGAIVAVQDADLELDPREFLRLIQPIEEGRVEVVYGSRFRNGGKKGKLAFYAANRALSALTNVLYGSRLTDIETCYKVLRRDVLAGLRLRASRFEIEPELTAQILKRGYRIEEVPIAYNPRSRNEGKKISWRDGVSAVTTLISQRFQ
jgi:glycosyltransferase involved in cell wall biosynthesis